MSWNNLAKALHDELCADLYCEEYIGDDSTGYTEHNLRRTFWEALVPEVKKWVVSKVHDDPVIRLRYELASYLHGDECTCPYSVEPDDLERAGQWLQMMDDAAVAETAARSKSALAAEELDPGSPWNIAGVDR